MTGISRAIVISTCYTQTPPINYGGIEQIAFLTAKMLASKGIETWLVASDNSPEPSELGVDYNLIKTIATGNSEESHYVAFRDHILDKNQIPIDEGTCIIDHSHEGWMYEYKKSHPEINLIKIVHDANPYSAPPPIRHSCMIGISQNLSDRLSYMLGIHIETAYNGVEAEAYKPNEPTKGDYMLFVSRIVREKGVHEAIYISDMTGLPLVIAGDDSPMFCDQSYVHSIISKCDGERIKYLGAVSPEKKVELMQGAMCTLLPVSFDEPFGLVAVESMISGTPVIALDRGAYRETVTTGGYVCKSVDEMIAKVKIVEDLDYDGIIENGLRFSSEKMVARYIELMNKCLNNPW